MADLLSSISGKQQNKKSRAHNQLNRLREFPYPVLLIDGYPEVNRDGMIMRGRTPTRWIHAGIDNWLLSVQSSGIKVAYAPAGQVAARIKYLVGYYEKER